MGYVKAKLKVEEDSDIIITFNPSTYSISDSVEYGQKNLPGTDNPISNFVAGNLSTLNMELMFDTYKPPTLTNTSEGGSDVSLETRKIQKLTRIKGSLHRPPLVTFSWGPVNFTGIVKDVKQTFTMFLSDGMPVRANVDITIEELIDADTGKRVSPFESPDRTKFRTIHEKQQLWQYAYEEYKDVSKWREIAKTNGIMNPLELEVGQIIKLPAIKNP